MNSFDPTRRRLLEIGASLAAGAAVSRTVFAEPLRSTPATTRRHDAQRVFGVAIVGLGSLSVNQIAPALRKTSHCKLAGIVTGTPSKAAQWKAQYNLPDRSIYDYATMDRMAENADIDMVYVVTPNAFHAEHTIKAARAGKHVLCEKPLEVSVAKCEAMIAACKAAKRQLAVGYRCRFEPHHLELARLAREKTFGAVKMIDAAFGFPIGDPAQWRLDHARSGRGPLMDVGIYALQSARMITGEEPAAISAFQSTTDPVKFKSVEESMTFQMTFPSGVLADCRTSYRVSGLNRVTALAERGSFGMEPAYNYGGNRAWRSDRQSLQFAEIDQFATEMDDFALCILNNTPTRVPGEEGLRDVRILMAAYESARSGRSVKLS